MQTSDGKLYGMTTGGGINDSGILFQYDPTMSSYIKKFEFTGTDGRYPSGSLVQASNGKFYGMTLIGGTNNKGVLFQYDPVTNSYVKKFDFNGLDGYYPYGSLVQAADGKLYGMTNGGGIFDSGVLFQYNVTTDVYSKKYDFAPGGSLINGIKPNGSLVQASNGKLYGMTFFGGLNDKGVIFEYDPATGLYIKKIDFTGLNGGYPYGSLTQALDGKLYGMTSGGGTNNQGVLFQYDPFTNVYVKKIDFTGVTNGSNPLGSLMKSSNGNLYGMTYDGGTNGKGVLFQYNPNTNAYEKKLDFNGFSNGANPYYSSLIEITVIGIYITSFNPGSGTIGTSITINGSDFDSTPTNNVVKFNGITATVTASTTTSITAIVPSGATTGKITVTVSSQTATSATDFVVNKANQTITFAPLTAKTFGDASFALGATSSSGLPVTYTSNNTAVATVSGNTVTIVGGGTTTIVANQAGNVDFNAAASVQQVLTINAKQQSIEFSQPTDKTLGDAAFQLIATATSTLPVTFSATSDKISIAGSQVTLLKAGRVSITASQAGNDSFNAAVSVDKSFCINPVKPTITASGINTETVTLTSNVSTGNQWFKDGLAISSATNTTLSVTASGVYKVQTKVDDCISEFSTDFPVIITGDLLPAELGISLSPNPVEEMLEIRGITGEVKNYQLFDLAGRPTTIALEKRSAIYAGQVRHLSQGIYVLQVHEGDKIHQIKFIKK
jgi:uncharacterized repeat protein (TIGR03803 family)